MKLKPASPFRRRGLAWLSALAFTAASVAAQDLVVNQFNDAGEVEGKWTRWWGAAAQTYEFDAAVDVAGNPASGSLKATIGFDTAAYTGDNQFSLQHYLDAGIDGTKFIKLEFDIRFDPKSPQRPQSADFGYLEFGLIPGDYSQLYLGNTAIAGTESGWVHFSVPIDPATPKLANIIGVTFKLWAGDGNAAGNNRLTGDSVFWLDNVKLIADPGTTPVPPPTLALQQPTPGLQIFASKPGAQYQRQNIRTTDPSYSWVGSAAGVTYSFTVADYPDATKPGFQTHLFLVPGSSVPTFVTAPDYNEPNVIFLDLQNNAEGGAYASFRHKINQPNGNAMIYAEGTLGGLGHTTPLGTWSLTLKGTTATLTTPAGETKDFTLPAETVALFDGPLYAYLGVQPNQPGNIGQSATFSRIQITGAATPIDDRFTTAALNPETWQVIAEDPAGILPVPPDTAYALSWTLPANGYVLQAGSGFAAGSFTDSELNTSAVQIGTRKVALVPTAALPAAGSGFFRLRQP